MYRVDVIRGRSDATLREILALSRATTPASWTYPDEAEYYAAQLDNDQAIHLLLRRGDEIIGYLLALPLDEVLADEEFRRADPALCPEPGRLYVETMAVLPHFGHSLLGGKLCLLLLDAVGEEAGRRGLNRFAMHARVSTGLSRALHKLYGAMITSTRRIERWPYYGGAEPTEYIELTYCGRRLRGGER